MRAPLDIDLARLIWRAQQSVARQEKRREEVLRANLPSFLREKKYSKDKLYRGYVLRVVSYRQPALYATIAETSDELVEHIEVVFGKKLNELREVKPLEVSEPMDLEKATSWLRDKLCSINDHREKGEKTHE